MRLDGTGSRRLQHALKSTGAQLLPEPIKHGSLYGHAEIARGGQRTVFLGTGDDQALSRVCVIKVCSDADQGALERVRRSVRTQLVLVDHASGFPAAMYPRDEQIRPAPWIPDILAGDLDAAVPWIAQDFRGSSLRRFLAHNTQQSTHLDIRDRRTDKDIRT